MLSAIFSHDDTWVQGFFEANLITTLTYAEDASSGNTTIPMYVVQEVATAIRYVYLLFCEHSVSGRLVCWSGRHIMTSYRPVNVCKQTQRCFWLRAASLWHS